MEHPFNNRYESVALPKSLWVAVTPEILRTDTLKEIRKSDVTIIGAGFTGLSSAIHLSQLGLNVTVLEAANIGWGASGRNNGQVIPGLKLDPSQVSKILGRDLGETLVEYSGSAPNLVFSLIQHYEINCDAIQKGWIQPALSDSSIREIESRVKQWERYRAPVKLLPEKRLEERLGTRWYKKAWIDERGGSVNPLAYVRGLAKAAISEGATIYTSTPVNNISRSSDRWEVSTPGGKVFSESLLICTNAYTGELNSSIRRSNVPVRTAQIASSPLAKTHWEKILPKGEAASDTSRLLTSFRITTDKRLVMGGAYAVGGDEKEILFSRLKHEAKNRFPYLFPLKWEYFWSGHLAITNDHLPYIFECGPNCYAPIGCNGRGIAMTTATGKALGKLVFTGNDKDCPIPVTKPKEIKFYEFRNIGIAANVAWCNFLDKLKI